MVSVAELQSWLRKLKPQALRYRTAEDEEWQAMALAGRAGSTQWKRTAEELFRADAVRVQAVTTDGAVLGTFVVREEEEDAPKTAAAKDTAALALVLDAQGRRISEAFEKGAEAASRGQDNLVDVVQILTVQWTSTMQAVHSLSMQLAKALRAAGGVEESGGDDLQGPMQQMMGMAMMKMMGMNGMPQQQDAPTNGKKEK